MGFKHPDNVIFKRIQLEKNAKAIGLTGDTLLQERQEKAKPVLNEFKKWLDDTVEITPPQNSNIKYFEFASNAELSSSVAVIMSYFRPDSHDEILRSSH
ncbi:hypothetical protein [uncultured Desulfobacter sp.]|uniref:hypothetical protein n=1 Tax=uncultured Desulfobacter sp. TaxID=240139 RepID=UPI002AA93D38|nr:hypothetical protein [uncultured Desulfobacter sp.]